MNRINFVFLIFWSVAVLATASQRGEAEQNRRGEKQYRVSAEKNIVKYKTIIERLLGDLGDEKLKGKGKPKGCTYKGKFIPEGIKSYITPCEFCNCEGGKVACAIIDCQPIPSGCKAVPVKGQCCPKIECCGGCEYNGHFIPEGNSTYITPCEWCSCNDGEVGCAILDCARPPDGCKAIYYEGQCCPSYDCSGCEYNGQFIAVGDTVYITPCEFCNCYEGQVACAIIDCIPIAPECTAIPDEGECCPTKIECPGGCNHFGIFIAEGNMTQTSPCEFCTCNKGEVRCVVQDCAPPRAGCAVTHIEGQCCPSYDCSIVLEDVEISKPEEQLTL